MPNDLPTDRLPTMAETRAMHEQAVRARKKKRLQKTLVTIAVTLLVITLLAALALFVRAKLQTLDKPLDAKTNQTAQAQPQKPLIEPEPQEPAQPEPNVPEAEPEADTLPESETEPAQDSPEESEPEETPAQEDPGEKTYTPASVTDATKTLDLELYSENALLIDLESNTVLVQKNADARIYPASMTKVMTVLVAAEHIENWDETFTMTQSIIDPLFLADASMAGFVHGEEVSMTELLYGAVLPSGAEATQALAIVTAGSEEAFAALMNEKAQALGLKDTHFVDASGLHDENHYTTLSDMAIIMQAALDNPHCREVLTSVNHTSPATAQNPEGVAMTNRFLYRIRPQQTGNVDIQAAKTGYTAQAMNCCVSYGIMENGRAAICVTAHAWTGDYCIADHLALYGTYCGT